MNTEKDTLSNELLVDEMKEKKLLLEKLFRGTVIMNTKTPSKDFAVDEAIYWTGFHMDNYDTTTEDYGCTTRDLECIAGSLMIIADKVMAVYKSEYAEVLAKLYKTAALHISRCSASSGGRTYSLASKYFLECGNLDQARKCYIKAACAWAGDKINYPKSYLIALLAGGAEFEEAKKAFKDTGSSRDEAALCIQKAIDIAITTGQYKFASMYHEEIAQLFKRDNSDIPVAIHHITEAQKCNTLNDPVKARECNSTLSIKITMLHMKLDQFNSAIKICVDAFDNNGEYGLWVLPALLYAFLCQLNTDYLNLPDTMHTIENNIKPDSGIRTSTEFKIIQLICRAENLTMFDAAFGGYIDSYTINWRVNWRVKFSLESKMLSIINELRTKYLADFQ